MNATSRRWVVVLLGAVWMFLGVSCTATDVNESIARAQAFSQQADEALRRGEPLQALELLDEAISTAESTRWEVAWSVGGANAGEVDNNVRGHIGSLLGRQASIYLDLGRHQECVAHADEALSSWYVDYLTPGRAANTHALRGLAHLALGHRQAAVADLEAGKAIVADAPEVLHLGRELALSSPAVLRAKALAAQNQWADAVAGYTAALQAEPHPAIRLLRGLAYLQAGNARAAGDDFTACIGRGADDVDAYFHRGRARVALQEYAPAEADFSKVIALRPAQWPAYFNRALCRERFVPPVPDLVVQDYDKVLQLQPDYIAALEGRAGALYAKGEVSRARVDLRRAQQLGSTSAEELMRIGEAANPGAGDLADLGIDDPKAFFDRWEQDLGQPKTAPKAAPPANKESLQQHSARLHWQDVTGLEAGYEHWVNGRHEEAVKAWSAVIEAAPTRAAAWFYRGEANLELGRRAAAIDDFTAAIRLAPAQAVAYLERAVAEIDDNRFDAAIQDATRALEFEPGMADAFAIRGLSRARKGELAAAVQDLGTAVERKTRLAWVHNRLAWIKVTAEDAQLFDPRQAVQLARRALELAPDDHNYLDTLGCALAATGDFAAAAATEQQAIDRCSDATARATYDKNLAAFKAGKTYLDRIRAERAGGKDGP
jgi:tetratricopeptide (TPR) repeat protein